MPFFCRLDAVNKLLDEKALTPAEVSFEIARLHGRDSCRLRGNDPFAMSNLPWRCNGQSMIWSSKPTFLWLCSSLFWFSNTVLPTIGLDADLYLRIESSFNPWNFCQLFLIRDMKQISASPLILNSISSTYESLTRILEVHIRKYSQLAMCSTVFYYSSISCSGMNDWMHCKLYLISNTTEMLYFLGSYGATIL